MFRFCEHFLCFLCALVFGTSGHENGPDFITVVVSEGNDAVLPCSVSTKESLKEKLFDWRKDQNKHEVFIYDKGEHYNNGRQGQDEQFRGRVSHFQQQLQFGNASILIRNTTISDSGNYTCDFPRLTETINIKLVVKYSLKDRRGENARAAPKPVVWLVKDPEDQVQLHCVVPGAFPKPKVEWKDSDGNILPAEEPQVLYGGDRYYITLLTTVTATNTNFFHCVATQEGIGHVIDAEIRVPDKLFKSSCEGGVLAGLFSAGFVTGAAVVLGALYVRKNYIKKVSTPKTNGSCNGESSRPLQQA